MSKQAAVPSDVLGNWLSGNKQTNKNAVICSIYSKYFHCADFKLSV